MNNENILFRGVSLVDGLNNHFILKKEKTTSYTNYNYVTFKLFSYRNH